MIKELYKHITTRIETLSDADNKPVIRWIDFDLGQLDQTPEPVSFPCTLITFGDASDFTTFQDGTQQSVMTVTLRIAFRLRERTHSKAISTFRDEALTMLDIVDAVHDTLQSTNGVNFGNFERTAIRNDRKADIRVFELDYRVVVFFSQSDWKANGGPFIHWRELPGAPALPGFCIYPA